MLEGARPWDPVGDGPDAPARLAGRTGPSLVTVRPDGDLFDPDVPTALIAAAVAAMTATPGHRYLLVTDRVKRLLALGNDGLLFPPNLWLGVRVNGDDDVWRAEDLLRCNSPSSFVWAEPRDGSLDLLPVGMLSWLVCVLDLADPDGVARLADRARSAGVPCFVGRRRTGSIVATPGAPLERDERPAALAVPGPT